ncbi:hypothetical protein ILUMI_07964 [Ignelater luminosus]|uniref:Uncharacterized protein n=1 Tax=Ignelater luminosus TaxID=2038154 RepID=A0A8K0DCB0_IGNLU|nr:hypothetical protein ILUMI_07964 [Ignelater luminosus]
MGEDRLRCEVEDTNKQKQFRSIAKLPGFDLNVFSIDLEQVLLEHSLTHSGMFLHEATALYNVCINVTENGRLYISPLGLDKHAALKSMRGGVEAALCTTGGIKPAANVFTEWSSCSAPNNCYRLSYLDPELRKSQVGLPRAREPGAPQRENVVDGVLDNPTTSTHRIAVQLGLSQSFI